MCKQIFLRYNLNEFHDNMFSRYLKISHKLTTWLLLTWKMYVFIFLRPQRVLKPAVFNLL